MTKKQDELTNELTNEFLRKWRKNRCEQMTVTERNNPFFHMESEQITETEWEINAVVRFVGILVSIIAPERREIFKDYREKLEDNVKDLITIFKEPEIEP